MITTTVNRMRQSGYWCADADRLAADFISWAGVSDDGEINIVRCLDYLGIGSTLHALGTPRPRYKTAANKVLVDFARLLVDRILLATIDSPDLDFPNNFPRAVWIESFDATKKHLRQHFSKLKFNSERPVHKLYYETVGVLVSELPLHIRLLHAVKYFLQMLAVHDKISADKERDLFRDKLYTALRGSHG